jgi:hypothetical protein
MSPSRARFVTLCQQMLALGVVVVALVPATRVVSLDVVGEQPGVKAGLPTIAEPEGTRSHRDRSLSRSLLRSQVSLRVAERGGG